MGPTHERILTPSVRELRALVVDDARSSRLLVRSLLELEGIGCDEAASVEGALAAVEGRVYDLVVLDLSLSADRDGLAVLQYLRESPHLADVPVVVLTGEATSEADVVTGLRRGADEYLTKPFEPAVLRARVASMLRGRLRFLRLTRVARRAADEAAAREELLTAAGGVQRSTLPAVPLDARGVRASGDVVSASAVGGDVFDVIPSERSVSVALVDAAGHGPSAALVAMLTRQALRESLGMGAPLVHVEAAIEAALASFNGALEASVCVGIVRVGKRIELLNRGLPPVVAAVGGELRAFGPRGGPFGLGLPASRSVVELPRRAGATFQLITDGLTGGDPGEEAPLELARRFRLLEHGATLAGAAPSLLGALAREALSALPGPRDDASLAFLHVDTSHPTPWESHRARPS